MRSSNEEQLRKELSALGAREFEKVALTLDSDRGLSALHDAQERGAEHPVAYAIKLFDSSEWFPSGEVRRRATNLHVDKACAHCGGDRFVFVKDEPGPYGEAVAPCKACNAEANVTFWRVDGTRVRSEVQ